MRTTKYTDLHKNASNLFSQYSIQFFLFVERTKPQKYKTNAYTKRFVWPLDVTDTAHVSIHLTNQINTHFQAIIHDDHSSVCVCSRKQNNRNKLKNLVNFVIQTMNMKIAINKSKIHQKLHSKLVRAHILYAQLM